MRGIDDTDREILRLLAEDARRPYSELAEAVDLSPPAVSDRVDRLQEIGLLRRFTVDIDRSLLGEGVPVLVAVRARPDAAADVRDEMAAADSVEHVFRTVDNRLFCNATMPGGELGEELASALAREGVREYDVHLLAETDWSPGFGQAELSPTCVECGNTVTREGETQRLDDEMYHFCCENCRETFIEKYERLREGA